MEAFAPVKVKVAMPLLVELLLSLTLTAVKESIAPVIVEVMLLLL